MEKKKNTQKMQNGFNSVAFLPCLAFFLFPIQTSSGAGPSPMPSIKYINSLCMILFSFLFDVVSFFVSYSSLCTISPGIARGGVKRKAKVNLPQKRKLVVVFGDNIWEELWAWDGLQDRIGWGLGTTPDRVAGTNMEIQGYFPSTRLNCIQTIY